MCNLNGIFDIAYLISLIIDDHNDENFIIFLIFNRNIIKYLNQKTNKSTLHTVCFIMSLDCEN